jgi:hypothetical protein
MTKAWLCANCVGASLILMRERRSFRSLGSMSLAEKRQKTLDPPSTSCSTLSLAIKLRTGRGQTEWRESGSQPASERVRGPLFLPLYLALCSRPPGTLRAAHHFAWLQSPRAQRWSENSKTSQISAADRFVVIPRRLILPRTFEWTFQPPIGRNAEVEHTQSSEL